MGQGKWGRGRKNKESKPLCLVSKASGVKWMSLFPLRSERVPAIRAQSSSAVYEQLSKWGVVFPEPKESTAFVMESVVQGGEPFSTPPADIYSCSTLSVQPTQCLAFSPPRFAIFPFGRQGCFPGILNAAEINKSYFGTSTNLLNSFDAQKVDAFWLSDFFGKDQRLLKEY